MSSLTDLGVPVFQAGGMPDLPADRWSLQVTGLVADPRQLSLADIQALPASDVDARLTSVSGFSVRAKWRGVLWRDFIAGIEPAPTANHATFTSLGGGYSTTVSLADLDHPRVLLAYGVDDQPLEREYGGPLRMVIPHLWGYKSAKWLAEIELTNAMRGGYWEDRGYPRTAPIKAGTTMDMNTGQRRSHGDGEITEF